ncbi:mitochondrial amidoxime-reducing component 1-like isoform X2 [Photinus pyralis]|nr:mitochondrial amidoxime-reducing component 1-like isoform X2 [Photinus pyralis]
MPILTIKAPNRIENKVVTISQHFNEKIPTIDCGDDAAKWISQYASEQKMELGIAFHDAKQRRNLSKTHQKYFGIYPTLSNDATGLHSDFSSYLLVGESSINDLKDRAPEANIDTLNFRPNILIEGTPPFAEDEWKWVKIGDVVLYFVKWCTRCVLTTVNPTTGIKSEQNEPLKTLRTYRMLKDLRKISVDGTSPLMGINMAYHSGEKINVGDVVYVGK